MEEEAQKVDLITLLRTFKKEGLENFIVFRKERLEKNYIPKSKIKEKIEEYKKDGIIKNQTMPYLGEYKNHFEIKALKELLGEE